MSRRDGPTGLPAFLLAPAAAIYGAAVAYRNRRFDRGRGVRRLECPVVSVGNLTVGGTGKTPLVAEIARRLAAGGARPIVALRGYRADTEGRSDEAELHRLALPGMPVVVGADRWSAIRAAGVSLAPPAVVVLDDGFQHRRLARDLDLVLVDATRPCLSGRLLPAGWLREPAESLRRADAVIVTRAEGVDRGLAAPIERLHGRPPIAWCRHAWDGFDLHHGGEPLGDAPPEVREPAAWIRGRRIATLLGIAHPEPIRAALAGLGAIERLAIPARDHQAYGPRRAERIARAAIGSGAECLVTTAKDWVKLRRWWRSELPVAVPRLRIDWLEGESAIDALLERLGGPRAASPA